MNTQSIQSFLLSFLLLCISHIQADQSQVCPVSDFYSPKNKVSQISHTSAPKKDEPSGDLQPKICKIYNSNRNKRLWEKRFKNAAKRQLTCFLYNKDSKELLLLV